MRVIAICPRSFIARIATFALVVIGPSFLGVLSAGEPGGVTNDVIERTIAALDDDEFSARQSADKRLSDWAADPQTAKRLSEQIARLLLTARISLEVRTKLESLQKRLPEVNATGAFEAAEIVPLLDRLGEGSYIERDGAARRLRAMLNQVELIGPLLVELKRRADDPQLTNEGRRLLEPLLDAARHAWLSADPAKVKLPPVSKDEILRRIDVLTAADDQPQDRFRRGWAERELADLIARDDTRAAVLEQLEAKIAVAEDLAISGTLRHIADLARPGLVAEVWRHGTHVTVQYLILDVPQHNEAADRPTHFDRADDNTAHCVSGNTLLEGDYPVRVAIPHPDPNGDAMFYLTNLSTPRRRLLYEYDVKRDSSVRLTEISERTTEHLLAARTVLDENHVVMLAQLDPHVVSRFVGRYFQAVPDQLMTSSIADFVVQAAKVNTVHTGLCYLMARLGTRDAVPALTQLARSGKLAKTSGDSQFNFAWIAALSIAQRDPWPGVDEWLLGLLDDNTTLVEWIDPPPQLGASAAAMLLDRHDVSAQGFGLYLTTETAVGGMRFAGHRFDSPEKDRRDIRRWWEKQKRAAPRISIP